MSASNFFSGLRKNIEAIVLAGSLAFGFSGCASTQMFPSNFDQERVEIERLNKEGYTRKYDTFAHKCLDAQKFSGANALDYKLLDDIIDSVKQQVEIKNAYTRSEYVSILRTIDDVLDGLGFSYEKTELLNEGLKLRKEGKRYLDCDTYSAVYMGLSDVLNLNLVTVILPDHVFIRCRYDSSSYFDWEATSGSLVYDDYYLVPYYGLKIGDERAKCMDSKSRDESLVFFYDLSLSKVCFSEREGIDMKPYYKALINTNPKDDYTLIQIGIDYEKSNLDSAIKYYHSALSVQESELAYDCIGASFFHKDQLDSAVYYYKKGIQLMPTSGYTYARLGSAYFKNGDLDSALKSYDCSVELAPNCYWCADERVDVLNAVKERDKKLAKMHRRKTTKVLNDKIN